MKETTELLKVPLMVGGLLWGIALLTAQRFDAAAFAAALATTVLLVVQAFGDRYLAITNQTKIVRHAFGAVVKPLAAAACVTAFFYAAFEKLPWIGVATAAVAAFIYFAFDAAPLYVALKRGARRK